MGKNEKVVIRLYPGQDDELIRWVRQFDMPGTAHGAKTRAIKKALRRGIQEDDGPSVDFDALQDVVRETIETSSHALNQQIRQAVQEALRASREEGSRDFTLGDIRHVVSAALVEELDRRQIDSLEGEQTGVPEEDNEEQEKVDELVKQLSDAAMQPGMGV
jgi:DNA-binding transcriptional MerR regulator